MEKTGRSEPGIFLFFVPTSHSQAHAQPAPPTESSSRDSSVLSKHSLSSALSMGNRSGSRKSDGAGGVGGGGRRSFICGGRVRRSFGSGRIGRTIAKKK